MKSMSTKLVLTSIALLFFQLLALPAPVLAGTFTATWQLGGMPFPVNVTSAVPIQDTQLSTPADGAGNSLYQFMDYAVGVRPIGPSLPPPFVSFDGTLKAGANAMVTTGSSGQPGAAFAAASISYSGQITAWSSDLFATQVQYNVSLFLHGPLSATGTNPAQTGNLDFSKATVGARVIESFLGSGFLQVTGGTTTQGVAVPGSTTVAPVLSQTIIAGVGTTFGISEALFVTAFANTFGGSLCCQLPQDITPTYPTAESIADFFNTAVLVITPITPGAYYTTDDGSTFDGPAAATPLPGALPLFATGLGALGLLGWRRQRKQAA